MPLSKPITGVAGFCARAASGHATAPPSSVMNARRFTRSPRLRAAGIDVDNSTPNHLLNIPVSERGYNINPRFSAFIGFVLHGYAHNDFSLRPFALNNFRFFDLSEQAPHEYPL
jgi:hypothetical protein